MWFRSFFFLVIFTPFFIILFSLALAGSQSEFKSCIEKHLEVGIMLKPHVWLISTLFSFRSSERVTLICDLHSYRPYSLLYCELKHWQRTIIYKYIYIYMLTSIQYVHALSCFICTLSYVLIKLVILKDITLQVQFRSIALTDCGEQRLRSSLCKCWLQSSLHTHAHAEPAVKSLSHRVCLKTTISHVFPDLFQKWVWLMSSLLPRWSDRRKIIVMTQLLRGHLFPVKLVLWQLTRYCIRRNRKTY